jgi:hypothetical protein
MNDQMKFNIKISKEDDGLFLASALGFVGDGNTVKEALDTWINAITDDAIEKARSRKARERHGE